MEVTGMLHLLHLQQGPHELQGWHGGGQEGFAAMAAIAEVRNGLRNGVIGVTGVTVIVSANGKCEGGGCQIDVIDVNDVGDSVADP